MGVRSVWRMAVKRHSRGTQRKRVQDKHIGGTRDSTRHTWAAIRSRVLMRDNHECQAKEQGCTGVAYEVDHVVPQYAGGNDEDDNLLSLCPECHSLRTSRQAHERAIARKALAKEQARRNVPGRKDRHEPL